MSQQQQEHQGIFTGSFSGLDLTSSAGDIEGGACTVFQNCDVSPDGAIVRRGGTATFLQYNYNIEARSWQASVTTKNATEYLVCVNDAGILITQVFDEPSQNAPAVGQTIIKSNVWKQRLNDVNFVLLAAPYDRLLILTDNHPPVELSFLERTLSFNVTASGANFAINAPSTTQDYWGWADTTASATIVSDRATRETYTVLTKNSYFSAVLAPSASLTVGKKVLTMASITWQWWAEAQHLKGNNFTQTVSRVNVTDLDQNVPVPVELITDITPPRTLSTTVLELSAWEQANLCGGATYVKSAQPNSETTYQFTTGGRYVWTTTNRPTLGPFFCTFGSKQAAGGIGRVTLSRLRKLPFLRGSGVPMSSVNVFLDGEPVSQSFSTCGFAYVAYRGATIQYDTEVIDYAPSVSFLVNSIDFSGGNRMPPAESDITLIHTGGVSFFGTAASASWLLNKLAPPQHDGKYIAAYGIGSFCDYVAGTFPTLGTVHRDRLVLLTTGGSGDQLAVSSVSDSTIPGEFYTDFQIDSNLQGLATEPFTINVTSDSRNRITALSSWQNSLLVFTGDSVYSVVAGEQFSQGSFRVELAAAFGAFNQRCVSVSDLSVVFMNRYGVYDLVNKPDTSQLGTSERSSKVRTLFGSDLASSASDKLHWLIFDEGSSTFYTGLATYSSLYTTRHLTLNTRFEAWSTFVSASPFRMLNPVKLYNRVALFAIAGSDKFVAGLSPNQPYYLDFAFFANNDWSAVVAGQESSLNAVLTPQRTFESELEFSPMLKDAEGVDVKKFKQRWVSNTPNGSLTAPRLPLADSLQASYLIGGKQTAASWVPFAAITSQTSFTTYPKVSYTSVTANGRSIQLTPPKTVDGVVLPNVVADKMLGMVYTSIAASRTFNAASMGRLKRLKRLHLQFDTSIVVGRKLARPSLSNYRQVNMAEVCVTTESNHQSNGLNVSNSLDSSWYNTGSSLTSTFYDTSYEVIGSKQHSIPLQGYGVSYKWWVTSVGAEAFKLSGYEFETTPQRDKRYQPG